MTWRAALKTPGALSETECATLAELAASTDARRALEVGHYHGRSTVVLLESLPAGCSFITIDHHRGDEWSVGTDPEQVRRTIEPHVGDRLFWFIDQDMLTVTNIGNGFGFVFYDANHSDNVIRDWWARFEPWLAEDCTLVFDDADWREQDRLRTLAEDAGFVSIRTRDYWRDPMDDKGHPDTYTLEVMQR